MGDMIIPEGVKLVNVDMLKIEVAFFNTRAKYLEFCKSNNLDDSSAYKNAGIAEVFTVNDIPYFTVSVFERSIPLLVHECCHIADFILQHKGIPVTMENTEIRAYLTEYLVSQMIWRK